MIYFIQDAGTLNVKIGFALNSVDGRRATLQTGNSSPLVVLATMPGDLSAEKELHRRFAEHRVAGEWFRPHPDILGLAIQAARRGPDADMPLHGQSPECLEIKRLVAAAVGFQIDVYWIGPGSSGGPGFSYQIMPENEFEDAVRDFWSWWLQRQQFYRTPLSAAVSFLIGFRRFQRARGRPNAVSFSPEEAKRLVDYVLRAHEKAYRRGFQQGHLIGTEGGVPLADVAAWRNRGDDYSKCIPAPEPGVRYTHGEVSLLHRFLMEAGDLAEFNKLLPSRADRTAKES